MQVEGFKEKLLVIGLNGSGIDSAIMYRDELFKCTGIDFSKDIVNILTPSFEEVKQRFEILNTAICDLNLPKKSKHNKARKLRFIARNLKK